MATVERILCATDFSPASSPPWLVARRLGRLVGVAGEPEGRVDTRVEEGTAAGAIRAVAAAEVLRQAEATAAALPVIQTGAEPNPPGPVLGGAARRVQAPRCPALTLGPRAGRPGGRAAR